MISLSYSAAQRYILSPMSWYLHYMLRLRPVANGSALAFGAALDSGLNSLLEDKRDGRELDILKAKARFTADFERWLSEEIQYTKADLDESILDEADYASGRNLSWCSLHKKGHILIDEYVVQVMPKIEEVYLVQHTISLTNELGDTFTGVIDFVAKINGKIYICDNKTTSVVYAADSASESEQLATYYEALRDKYDIAGVCYVTIPKKLRKKKRPVVECSMIFGTISEDLLNKTFQQYERVLSGIRNAHFACTRNQSGGCCSTPWGCAYKNYCQSGGTDTTGLKFEKKERT